MEVSLLAEVWVGVEDAICLVLRVFMGLLLRFGEVVSYSGNIGFD